MNFKRKSEKGLSIIELVIVVSIISVFIISVALSYSLLLRLAFSNLANVKGTFLAEETIEVVKFLKVEDWAANIASLDSGEDHFLSFNGEKWLVVSENHFIDNLYERKFVLSDVYRDASGAIVEPLAGELDEGTKKVTAYISWRKDSSATTTKILSTYITDIN